MTLFERAIQRGIEEKLISSADWQKSLRLVSDGVTCKATKSQASEPLTSGRLFGEPVWSMLIYLFVMHSNGRTATMTDCCRVTGTSRSSCLGCVEMLVEEEILILQGNPKDAESPSLTLSSSGHQMVEDALRKFLAADSEERFAGACMPIGDHRINERIAREMNISLKAVEMHRANMAAKSE